MNVVPVIFIATDYELAPWGIPEIEEFYLVVFLELATFAYPLLRSGIRPMVNRLTRLNFVGV